MKRLKKILRPLLLLLAVAGVFVGLAWVERSTDRAVVSSLDVQVDGPEGVHFMDAEKVRAVLLERGTIVGASVGDLDLPGLERHLRTLPAVSDAQIYHAMDGVLRVHVRQRTPIARVLTSQGPGCYIDTEGWVFPADGHPAARVLVVTGDVPEGIGGTGVWSVHGGDGSSGEVDIPASIHALADQLRGDPMLDALIDHATVDEAGEFELFPRVGGHVIALGTATDLAGKFAKLKAFYGQGVPQTDWRRYSRIDLRYKDQIITTRRTMP